MRNILLRGILRTVLVFLGCVPAAIVLTFFLLPLWSWIEEAFGIESMGHSGPAEWCFVFTHIALALIVLIALHRRRRGRQAKADPSSGQA